MSASFPIAALPAPVAATVLSGLTCEFATLTAKGVPLNTPMLYSVQEGGTSIDVSTGVSYPAKAERVRRNNKVGLLIEGADGGPVVSIGGRAAVRDADIQANALRYASDFRDFLPVIGGGRPWKEMRNAFWYWARIFIHCTPEIIRWWPSASATDLPGEQWDTPAPIRAAEHDPAPEGRRSTAPDWRQTDDWQSRAREVASSSLPAHLTVTDAQGYPLPFRTWAAHLTDQGFSVDVPTGAPWERHGAATLCFSGQATFVGRLSGREFTVERALPDLPMVQDTNQIFEPAPEVRQALIDRLTTELIRRGQSVPAMPTTPP